VFTQVVEEWAYVRCRDSLLADELRPTEAVGAVCGAALSTPREEQNGLPVFVLDARELGSIQERRIEIELAGTSAVSASPSRASSFASVIGSSISGCGNTSLKMGSSGTLDQSISSSWYPVTRNGNTCASRCRILRWSALQERR